MRLQINKEKFISGFERDFHKLNARSKAGLSFFVDKFNVETRLKNIPQFAYVLSTTYHESTLKGTYFQPVKEGRETSTSPRRANQDRYWFTGFYGRGFPQTTHKENYEKAGKILGLGIDYFLKNPDALLIPEYAYEVMVVSMVKGLYRTDKAGKPKNLDRYLNSKSRDYINARDIINGDIKKNGAKIAGYAFKFEALLKECSEVIDGNNNTNALAYLGVDTAATIPDADLSLVSDSDFGSSSGNQGEQIASMQTTIRTENTDIQTTTSTNSEEKTTDFAAYIPQIDTAKDYIKKGFFGSVTAAIGAFWLGLPVWVQVGLVVLVVAIVVGGIYVFIRYHKEVFAYVTAMNTLRATQGVGNPVLKKWESK